MMMMMMKDEWIRAAMTDDVVVAELLLRLKQSHASPPLLTPFKWGLRLPRSRSSSRCDVVSVRKDREPTRRSPTTPLSWSGGASPSAAADADAFEDCSRSSSIRFAAARSKVTALSETTNTNTKRSRRKKTFAELKEEEILLLKERTYLKKELATLRVTFKEQRATNESLKRMKIDFHLNLVKGTGAAATDEAKEAIPREEPHKMEGPSEDHSPSIVPVQALSNDLLQSESCQVEMNDTPRDNVFMLPDLNMMAMEDDIGSETLYGMI